MAITVTQAFKDAWLNKTWKAWRREVRIKRRYWNGAAFTHEASWQTLRQDQVKLVPGIPQEVDSEFQAIFQISEFEIEVDSAAGEMIVDVAPPSFWAADDTATDGYEPVRSEIEVWFILTLQDGSEEAICLFSGIITDDPVLKADGLTASIPVGSNAILIADSDAEKVSDVVTLEDCVPNEGDGSTTDFKTTSKGVAAVEDLQKAGSSLTQGRSNDWTVDKVGEDVQAEFEIHSVPVPQAGESMKWSGRKWKQNISVDDLAGLVLDNAGFPAGKREITPVTFPGGLSGFKRVDTQSEWESAGSLQNISTVDPGGTIRRRWHLVDDFTDGDYTSDPIWTAESGASAVVSGRLQQVAAGSTNVLSLPWTNAYGSWSFRLQSTDGGGGATFRTSRVYVTATAVSNPNGYVLVVPHAGGGQVLFRRVDGGAETTLITIGPVDGADHEYRITRGAGGEFNVYLDGVLKGTATDNTHTSSAYFLISTSAGGGASVTLDFDDFYFTTRVDNGSSSLSDAAAVYESEEFDLLAAPTAWSALEYAHTLNGGTIVYETAVASVAGGPYDAWVEIQAGTNTILSALKRYLKVRITITPAGGSYESPSVDSWRANFSTTNVFISVANLSGLDAANGGGWAAIERYVAASGYAMGLRGNGNYFLRPKDVLGEAVAKLNQDNCLKRLLEFDPGSKRVRNVGRCRYGDYVAEYDGADAGEASPTSEQRFGRKPRELNLGGVIFSNDVNIGEAQAQISYEDLYRRKRRWRFLCWLVPWLELLDRVEITFLRDPMAASPVFGDPLMDNQPVGRFPVWGEPRRPMFVKDQVCRILGWTPAPDEHGESILYVEEILS